MGRPRRSVRPPRRRLAFAFALAATGMLLLPAIVAAHPLGNFTINHYAEVRVEPDRVLLDVVIDEAEIPAFQARSDLDTDGDGSVSDAETEAGRLAGCSTLARSIGLTADGTPLKLVTLEAGLAFPPGVGGLSTMRQVCAFEAPLATVIAGSPIEIGYTDRSFPERIGWREIVARGSGVSLTAVDGLVRDATVSQRLTSYPAQLIPTPLSDTRLVVRATLGGPTLPPFDVPDAQAVPGAPTLATPAAPSAPVVSAAPVGTHVPVASALPAGGAIPGGVGAAELPSIFRQTDLTPLVVLLSLATAAALGAGHALTPGHGKTLMAAYLVGTRGTALHALGLGLSVSVSHTAGILVLAGVVVGLSDVVAPDVVVRWAPIVAAASIAVIGGWMLLTEIRRRSGPMAAAHEHEHDHAHEHEHAHAHEHARAHDHAHDRSHALEHSHGGVTHSHAPAPGSTITWRSLFLLGLAGGLIPSTSALLILLGSIAAGRPAFGFVLVVAFGLGMAAVMGGVGFALVAARDRVERVELGNGLARVRETVPLLASVVVLSFGLFLTAQALGGTPTL